MPLALVLGPANSAKAGEVLGAYAAAARRDALLVVPTAADAAHYDRELAAGGVALGRALTFGGLIDEIARRTGYDAIRLSGLQRERVLRLTVASLELPALGDSALSAGFPAAAGALIAELASARVTPQRFAAALRTWAADDPGPVAYAHDLAALALAYARALERTGRTDAEGFTWGALDALRGAPHRWGSTPVFFYGFDDLTAPERDAVETLHRAAGAPVTVSLTYEPSRAALAARAGVVEELRGQAGSVRTLESVDEHYAPGARDALHHIERFLFEPGSPRIDPGGVVALMEAGGERAEAELIAAEVLAALREGVPPEEIAIVCRSVARSGALLERCLERYGVLAASARRVALGHTALGRALLALGRLALLPEPSARDLLSYLRTPGVASPDEVDRLEATVRRRGLTSAAAAGSGLELPEIDALRGAADPGAELARQATRLLAEPRRRSAALLDADEQRDARAAAAVVAAVAELRELGGAIAGPELLDLLEGLSVPACAPAGAGAVLIAEPLAIRARRFRRVLVCGLCEGEFPASAAGDPFLGEDRRRELALSAGLALPAQPDALDLERYLFYACVSRATERLVLSYRSSDEDGNLVLASPFLDDVAELFVPEWRERRRRRLLADVVWDLSEAPTVREGELSLAAEGAADWHAPSAGSAGAETRVLGEAALGHIRHSEVVSAGALESFADCPVKWLIERQLEPEELEPDPEPLARGNFMHDVLERVVAGLGAPVTPETLPAAMELVDGIVREPPASLAPGRPAEVRAAILHGIEADLRRYLRHEAGDGSEWTPRGLELRFGFEDEEGAEDGLPGVVLGEGDEQVRLRGMIDRVDVDPADPAGRRAVVRDYKSGANRIERAGGRWATERQFQVALYMIAVRRLLDLEPIAGFYQPLTGRELRARGVYREDADLGRCVYSTDAVDAAALEELLAEIERQAVAAAATLRRGELTPCPQTCSRDGCRHPGICWA